MSARRHMDAALRTVVAPRLRAEGFKGSLPHFRRISDDRIDLLSVQHSTSGGKFCVEAACCGPDGYTTPDGQHVSPKEVTTFWIMESRSRIRVAPEGEGDHWFVYGPSYGETDPVDRGPDHYERVAEEAWSLIATCGREFWERWRDPEEPGGTG